MAEGSVGSDPGATGEVVLPRRPTSRWRPTTFDALRFRDYRLLWLGQLGASMGMWMDQVTRGWLIYSLTNSPFDLGLVMAFRALPFLLFGLIAGVFADRYGRKNQIVIAQSINVVLNLGLAILVTTGHVQAWHVFLSAFLSGCAQAFQQPARQTLISDIVGDRHLMNAVALNSAVLNLSRTLGPALGGAIIALAGIDGAYYAQALAYLLATVATVQVIVPKASPSRKSHHLAGSSMWQNIGEGLRYIWANHSIRYVMFLALIPLLLGQPYTGLMALFARDVYDIGATGQGILLTSAGVGAVLGALSVASMGNFRHKGWLLLGGAGVFGVGLLGFASAPVLFIAMPMLAVAGLSNTVYNSVANTILQTHTPTELRGRVLSVYYLDHGLVPLGTLLAGTLATFFGGPWAVGLMGSACALLALSVALGVPQVRRLE